jgi:hypothetical protein
MSKLKKQQEALDRLHRMVRKQAEEAQEKVTGKPGEDTHPESASESVENHDKNEVKESKNDPQGHDQKPATDASTPADGAEKSAAERLEDLARSLVAEVRKSAEEAQDKVTGKPGEDTKPESASEEVEDHDKNEVKESKNDPQGHSQKVAQAELNAFAEKLASYELGREIASAYVQNYARVTKTAQEAALLKEAGRRDFDMLVARAVGQLEQDSAGQDKYARDAALVEYLCKEAGSLEFDRMLALELLKQQENNALSKTAEELARTEVLLEKIAELEGELAFDKALHALATEQVAQEELAARAEQEKAEMAKDIAKTVLEALKQEVVADGQA